MNRIEFCELVDELSRTMQHSQIALEQTARDHFLSYFSKNDDVLVPDTRQVNVSYFEQDEKKQGSFFVPTASLVSHDSLELDEISVTLQANLHMEGSLLYADFKRGGQEAEPGDMGEDGNACNCKVELKFKNRRPAEGIMETINMLNKSI